MGPKGPSLMVHEEFKSHSLHACANIKWFHIRMTSSYSKTPLNLSLLSSRFPLMFSPFCSTWLRTCTVAAIKGIPTWRVIFVYLMMIHACWLIIISQKIRLLKLRISFTPVIFFIAPWYKMTHNTWVSLHKCFIISKSHHIQHQITWDLSLALFSCSLKFPIKWMWSCNLDADDEKIQVSNHEIQISKKKSDS